MHIIININIVNSFIIPGLLEESMYGVSWLFDELLTVHDIYCKLCTSSLLLNITKHCCDF